MKLEFRLPTIDQKEYAIEYINELIDYKSLINGTGGLDVDNYETWVKSSIKSHNGLQEKQDWVPASTYFVYNEEDILIGMVNIRHKLNKYLILSGSGHVGYSVRPSQRRKGYATEILRKALNILKQDYNVNVAIIGCYKDNIGSKKAIQNNGGIFVREVFETDSKMSAVYNIDFERE